MGAKNSVLGLKMYFSSYLRSAMVRFPFLVLSLTMQICKRQQIPMVSAPLMGLLNSGSKYLLEEVSVSTLKKKNHVKHGSFVFLRLKVSVENKNAN